MTDYIRKPTKWEYCDFWEFAVGGGVRLSTDEQIEDEPYNYFETESGTSSEGMDCDYVLKWFFDCESGLMAVGKTCSLCSTPFQSKWIELTGDDKDVPDLDSLMGYCPYCGHWRWCVREQLEGVPESLYEAVMVSKLRSFDDLPEYTAAELSQALRANDKIWTSVDPLYFEKFVGDVLRANYTNCEVIHVGRSHDRGVDLIFTDAGKKQHLVQVKCHQKPDKSEGAPTVRSLLGALVQSGKLQGILVSNAGHYTREAKVAVSDAWHNSGMVVELYDRGKLNRMLDPLMPDKPWRSYMKRLFPEIVEYY
jgi:hypothetical protein